MSTNQMFGIIKNILKNKNKKNDKKNKHSIF